MKIASLEVFYSCRSFTGGHFCLDQHKEHLLALLFYNIILSVTQCLADHWGAQLLQSGGEHKPHPGRQFGKQDAVLRVRRVLVKVREHRECCNASVQPYRLWLLESVGSVPLEVRLHSASRKAFKVERPTGMLIEFLHFVQDRYRGGDSNFRAA